MGGAEEEHSTAVFQVREEASRKLQVLAPCTPPTPPSSSNLELLDTPLLSTCRLLIYFFLFHYGLLQDTEYSSLCYTVGPCCLSILYIIVCIC